MRTKWYRCPLAAAALAAVMAVPPTVCMAQYADKNGQTIFLTNEHNQNGSRDFTITTVSTRNDLIAGGQVLVRIDVSAHILLDHVAITLNDRDVTGAFEQQATGGQTLVGIVTGLELGDNLLEVSQVKTPLQSGREQAIQSARLELTNFPVIGPVTSGPHMTPYECRTVQSDIGQPLDSDCSAATRVDFFYRTTARTFAPLTDPTGPRPADLAFTTTNDGNTVPYIVRVESGTIDRTIYRIAVLDDPGTTPFVPGPGWNRKLIVSFGGGCDAQYNQGVNHAADALSDNELSRGFAFAISTELVNNLHCNAALQGEDLMMLKQHFVETYGEPKWTLGLGGSGGAIQQYLIAEMFPGLLDGLQPDISFPDAQLLSGQDCRLLVNVYNNDPTRWTEAKQDAVNGFAPTTCESWVARSNLSTTGVSGPPCGLLDQNLVFNPVTNPEGARCDVQDMLVNVLGRDPTTGFARRPGDNTGVQYGLAALNSGAITPDDFIALNEQVGGFDVNGNIVMKRSVGDLVADLRIYQSGLLNGGAGGLDLIPILTQRTYFDLLAGNAANIHDRFEDFVIRARLERANGNADNQVIWTAGPAGAANGLGDTNLTALSLDTMNQWLDNIAADPAPRSLHKVVRNKPAGALDACFDGSGNEIVEPASLTGSGQCNTLYPIHSQPRLLAGMPVTNDVVKCQLRRIDPRDYKVSLTPSQMATLTLIFPDGVCDYSKPSVGQVPMIGTYLRFSMDAQGNGNTDP